MAYTTKDQFECLEALRKVLFEENKDLAERLTPGVPLLHTLAEIMALMGIPVDLTLTHDELVCFIWDTVTLLKRRSGLVISNPESIQDTVVAVQDQLLSEVLQEYATGIIITQDEIIPVQETQVKTAEKLLLKDSYGNTIH